MKKNLIAAIFLFFGINTLVYAKGETGDYTSLIMPDIIFGNVEGAYNWIQNMPFSFNGHSPTVTKQPWGGRASGGLLYFPVDDQFGMGLEAGWGYYGGVKMVSLRDDKWSAQTKLNGTDVLFDFIYRFEYLDVLGDVGFLVQNQQLRLLDNQTTGPVREALKTGLTRLYDQSGIFPEIKVGFLYHLSDYWGISFSYLHVFGSATQNEAETDSSGEAISGSGSDQGNPSLNTLMLGLRLNVEL